MSIWHIVEVVLFVILYIGIYAHSQMLNGLENRVSDLEEKKK